MKTEIISYIEPRGFIAWSPLAIFSCTSGHLESVKSKNL